MVSTVVLWFERLPGDVAIPVLGVEFVAMISSLVEELTKGSILACKQNILQT